MFLNASQDCYAVVLFLRTESSLGVPVNLVLAKSRVAPIKKLTTPRLELLGSQFRNQTSSQFNYVKTIYLK